jgi:hypothetical protein
MHLDYTRYIWLFYEKIITQVTESSLSRTD